MDKHTLEQFKLFIAGLAAGYGVGVDEVANSFTVNPSVEQKLTDKIVEKSTFLPKINVLTVKEIKGENLLGSVTGPISSRTDTSQADKERKPRNVSKLESLDYECVKTDRDVAIRYQLLDAWAKFPDFFERILSWVYARIALDREIIGWHGTSAAATTSLESNPLLQDVNKGWIQYVQDRLPENILHEGSASGVITVGSGGDFENLDYAVHSLTEGIPSFKRQNLVALIGAGLISNESGALFKNHGQKPTEKVLLGLSKDKFGGLPWDTPSGFPEYGLAVTSYDNLSLYIQEGSQRRQVIDNPKKDQIEDYQSCNEAFVVEDPEKFVAFDFNAVEIVGGDPAQVTDP